MLIILNNQKSTLMPQSRMNKTIKTLDTSSVQYNYLIISYEAMNSKSHN